MTNIRDIAGMVGIRVAMLIGATFGAAILVAGSPAADAAGAPIVYPAQGQTQARQRQDESDCRGWAQQQTGFNPSLGPSYYASAPPPQQGGQVVRGAVGGAALGAVGGAIAGDAGKGAAIGAGVGAVTGLLRKAKQHQAQTEAQNQANAQYNQMLANYNRHFATCMQGRGYAVN